MGRVDRFAGAATLWPLGSALWVQRQNRTTRHQGQQIQIGMEDMLTDNVKFHQDFGGYGEFDGVQLEKSQDMIVKRRQGQLGHKVQAIRDPDGTRNNMVVRANELWVSRLRAGVGVDRGVVEG
jgi:hypothetical protein